MGSQEIPGVTGKFVLGVQNEAGQRLTVLPRECTGRARGYTLFQQHKRWHCTWISPDDQYQNWINYILCSQIWKSSIQSATRLEADCGSDHELLIDKFRLWLKKVGKLCHSGTTKSKPLWLYSRSDKWVQEIRSDRVSEELWTEVCDIVQEAVIKTIPKKKKCKKAKWLSEEGL